MSDRSFYARYGRWNVLVALVLLPFTVWGAAKALQSTTNEARDWLPRHYPETVEYEWFSRHFGSDDFILVTWESCTLEDPRLAQLTEIVAAQQGVKSEPGDAEGVEAVQPPPAEHDNKAGESLFGRVVSGPSLLDELLEPTLHLTREEAVERLRGSLVGPDREQSCAVVLLSRAGRRNMHAAIEELRQLTIDKCGVPAAALRLGGLPVVNEAINVAGIETLRREAFLASLIGLIIAWRLFRTLRLTLAVCVTGLYSAAASAAVVWLSGTPMNSILITMAPLVFVAATSGAIHLANYYRDAVQEHGPAGAADRAVAHAWLPLGLATGTTAVGLLSLLYSDLAPIRQFGLFSAVGVVLALLLTILFLPAVIQVWPSRDQPTAAGNNAVGNELALATHRRSRLAETVVRHYMAFTLAAFALLAAFGIPLFQMKTSVDIMRLFSPNAPILDDYAWLEQRLGYLMPVEVVVHFPEQDESSTLLEKLEFLHRIELQLKTVPSVGSSLSAAAFLPDISRAAGPRWLRRSVTNTNLARQYDRFQESGYLALADGEELWRIGLRVGPFKDLDYERLLGEMRAAVAALPQASVEGGSPVISFTGVMPVVHKARLSLLRDLLFGLSTDLLLIFVAMVVLMRHWSSGLLLLLVSVFPTTIVFGLLVWMGVVVEIGALMGPCVALGVTVDDVIHFLLWFRRGIQQGMDRPQAVLLAYAGCARAMCQSWAILGLGLSVLLLSSFVPNMQFGASMVALLTVGLVGNLFFLPALLAGPLGGVIAASVRKPSETAAPQDLQPQQAET